MPDAMLDAVAPMAPQVAHWTRKYAELTKAQREEYGPFAAKRWPTAYARRSEPGWDAIWKTLLAYLATDERVFARVERELAEAERDRINRVVAWEGAR